MIKREIRDRILQSTLYYPDEGGVSVYMALDDWLALRKYLTLLDKAPSTASKKGLPQGI
jgi:hypothetical protein